MLKSIAPWNKQAQRFCAADKMEIRISEREGKNGSWPEQIYLRNQAKIFILSPSLAGSDRNWICLVSHFMDDDLNSQRMMCSDSVKKFSIHILCIDTLVSITFATYQQRAQNIIFSSKIHWCNSHKVPKCTQIH